MTQHPSISKGSKGRASKANPCTQKCPPNSRLSVAPRVVRHETKRLTTKTVSYTWKVSKNLINLL